MSAPRADMNGEMILRNAFTMLAALLGANLAACSGGSTSSALPLPAGGAVSTQSVARLRTVAAASTQTSAFSSKQKIWPAPGDVLMPSNAWTRPIPPNPPVAPQSQAWLDQEFNSGYGMSLLQFEANSAGGNGDGNSPVYYATSVDPSYTIHCTMYSHCPEEGQTVQIPVGARPNDGGDRHMAIVNSADDREDDFWLSATPNGKGGALNIGYGGHGSLRGDGTNYSATSSGGALTAGLLREADLIAGFIPHALYITTHCASSQHVYPAVGSDDSNPKCPPMGTRVYLDVPAATIAAEKIPAWTKTYLMAWHTYGAIISDHGGDDFALMLEHDYTYSSFGGPKPWLQFATYVQNDPASKNVWAQPYDNVYHIVFPTGDIDVRNHLKVLMPCVNTGTC